MKAQSASDYEVMLKRLQDKVGNTAKKARSRLEIPTPEIDIVMPSIVIPSIPSVNVNLPRIRVTPRIRTRGVMGPI